MSKQSRVSTCARLVLAGLTAGCGGGELPTTPRGVNVRIVAGDNQRGVVGSVPAEAVTVQVRDDSGVGLEGVFVKWRLEANGLARGDLLVASEESTSGEGFASTFVRLPAKAGTVRLQASLPEHAGALAEILLTAEPGPLAAVSARPPNVLLGMGGLLLTTDAFGNELPPVTLIYNSVETSVVRVDEVGTFVGLSPGRTNLAVRQGSLQEEVPIEVWRPATFLNIAVGHRHSCGVDLVGRAFCWGSGENTVQGEGAARLGGVPVLASCLSSSSGITTLCANRPTEVTGSKRFLSVAVGADHSCAISVDRDVLCWGLGPAVGRGESGAPNGPELVAAGPFTEIVAGDTHTCALRNDGVAECWGENSAGQLGDGTFSVRSVPSTVASTERFKALGAGFLTTCGITMADQLFCWGQAARVGRSLPPGSGHQPLPAPVDSEEKFVEVDGGRDHMCALALSGTVFCWGASWEGQVGIGQVGGGFSVPVPVSPERVFVSVSAGGRQSCATDGGGSVWCWGANGTSQLGISGASSELAPVQIPIGSEWIMVATGGGAAPDGTPTAGTTCGVKNDRTALCWGSNMVGQLGVASSLGPIVVARPVGVAPEGFP